MNNSLKPLTDMEIPLVIERLLKLAVSKHNSQEIGCGCRFSDIIFEERCMYIIFMFYEYFTFFISFIIYMYIYQLSTLLAYGYNVIEGKEIQELMIIFSSDFILICMYIQ